MRMTFDYILPQIAAQNETLQVSEHGVLDLEDGTLDFCIGDVSHLKGRVIPVEGLLYRITRVEYAIDGKVSDGTMLSENAVGILYLGFYEESGGENVTAKSKSPSLLAIAFMVVCVITYGFLMMK